MPSTWYRGSSLGYRLGHFPCSGLIIALAANSSVNNNDDALFSTAVSVYQTLEKAGAVHAPSNHADGAPMRVEPHGAPPGASDP